MKLSLEHTNILVNCAKTIIRVLSETEELKKSMDFSVEEFQEACDRALEQKLEFRDLSALHFAGVWCYDTGGLEAFGLKYDKETINEALNGLEIGE